MSLLSKIKGAALGSLLTLPSVAHAQAVADPNCWRNDETDAARFEDFRLRLLVGALNCKNYLPGAATSYNSFLAAKKDLVLANMYVVRAHFIREAGVTEGADQFANYETLAGNRYSSPIFDRAKCETIDTYIRLATTLADAELVKIVAVLAPGPLPSGCKIAPRPVPELAVVATPVPAIISPEPVRMTDAQRIAASNAATRQLIASRASLTKVNTVPTPVAMAPASPEATLVPATLLVPEPGPALEAKPVKPQAASEPPKSEPVTIPPGAAQALADAAKALAAAAAAMQPGAH